MPQPPVNNSRNWYARLGRAVFAQHPELVESLLSGDSEHVEPLESDLTKLPYYFHRFCEQQHLEPAEYVGFVRSVHRNYKRKVFVAAVLHLYQPSVYVQHKPKAFKLWDSGLSRRLSDLLGIAESNMSNLIKQVVRWHDYDDFKGEVEAAVQGLQDPRTPLTEAVNRLMDPKEGRQVA